MKVSEIHTVEDWRKYCGKINICTNCEVPVLLGLGNDFSNCGDSNMLELLKIKIRKAKLEKLLSQP